MEKLTDSNKQLMEHSQIGIHQQAQFPISNVCFNADNTKQSLPIPEMIEMLKNLAACNEKSYKWEQSTNKLKTILETDPNKVQLMQIIDYIDHKMSTREKAIYLYKQLGHKCREHGNYIGAAKAYERAAGLLMDITDQSQLENTDKKTLMSTIDCLESAICNYDAIHKYKHAGTLHYRCSKLLSLMNASHKLVEQHHIKALEYFTKPDHELKQRKRIDGFKISCYSSSSTWAMTHTKKSIKKKMLTTTHHHKTITTNHMIKFHPEETDNDDDDDNDELEEEFLKNESPIKETNPISKHSQICQINNASINSKFSYEFNNEDSLTRLKKRQEDYLNNTINEADDNETIFNESMPTTPTTPSSLASLNNSTQSSPMGQSSSGAHKNSFKKEQHSYHHSELKHHQYQERYHHKQSSYSSFHHRKQKKHLLSTLNREHGQKIIFRCIEDRIESAKKLVKKLHKLCPFYEVSTIGEDAGRVYCKICDRYLGAVSSTLKNHINTQEHRQACEDNSPTNGSTQQPMFNQTNTMQIKTITNNSVPMVTYPLMQNGPNCQSITGNNVGQQSDLASNQQMTYMNNNGQMSLSPTQQSSQLQIATDQRYLNKNFLLNYNSNNNEMKTPTSGMIHPTVPNNSNIVSWQQANVEQEMELLNNHQQHQYRSVLTNQHSNHINHHHLNQQQPSTQSTINNSLSIISHHNLNHHQQMEHYEKKNTINNPVFAYN